MIVETRLAQASTTQPASLRKAGSEAERQAKRAERLLHQGLPASAYESLTDAYISALAVMESFSIIPPCFFNFCYVWAFTKYLTIHHKVRDVNDCNDIHFLCVEVQLNDFISVRPEQCLVLLI